MRICTIDGTAHHAKYLLRVKELPSVAIQLPACGEGFLCFTDRELDRAEGWLKERGVEYKIEELQPPPGFEKTRGVKYASRSEAIAHIERGTEPESLIVPRLRERLAAAELKAEAAEQKALQAETRARATEDRLLILERGTKSAK